MAGFSNVGYDEAMRRARECVPLLLERAQKCEDTRVLLPENEKLLHAGSIVYFVGRETPVATRRPGMAIWREHLFVFLSKNTQSASQFFRLPPDQVMEVGMQIEI